MPEREKEHGPTYVIKMRERKRERERVSLTRSFGQKSSASFNQLIWSLDLLVFGRTLRLLFSLSLAACLGWYWRDKRNSRENLSRSFATLHHIVCICLEASQKYRPSVVLWLSREGKSWTLMREREGDDVIHRATSSFASNTCHNKIVQ